MLPTACACYHGAAACQSVHSKRSIRQPDPSADIQAHPPYCWLITSLGYVQGVTSPLVGQMFFRASLFSAFGQSKLWLARRPDGTMRKLTDLDFFKARYSSCCLDRCSVSTERASIGHVVLSCAILLAADQKSIAGIGVANEKTCSAVVGHDPMLPAWSLQ